MNFYLFKNDEKVGPYSVEHILAFFRDSLHRTHFNQVAGTTVARRHIP